MDLLADVVARVDGQVGTLVLSRPSKRNALTMQMYDDLAQALEQWADPGRVGAVVLTGSGGCFTAGNDLTELGGVDVAPAKRFLRALVDLPVPLVAAVDGPALGVGTTLLLHCDLVLATPSAVFGLPFVDLGLTPEAACTLLLPRRVGQGRATRLALLGERIDAATAVQWLLVDEICTDETALLHRAGELAAALTAKPRGALIRTRALLRDGAGTVDQRLQEDSAVLEELLSNPVGATR